MNLKLAKKIRQGMREMAQAGSGAMKGRWPDDYEGEIPRKRDGSLWAVTNPTTTTTTESGEVSSDSEATKLMPERIMIRLKLASVRQVYKRAKRMVK